MRSDTEFKFCWEDRKCHRPCSVRDQGDIFCWRSQASQNHDDPSFCETCEYRLRWVRGEYDIDDFITTQDRRSAPRDVKKVLVIDDEPSILFAFEETVRILGYDCISAGDGEEAWILARGINPDLIITDIVLPRVNGLDFYRRLLQDPETKNIPVIVVTARDRKKDADLCRDLGAEAFLIKPFSLTDLTGHIERILSPPHQGAAN